MTVDLPRLIQVLTIARTRSFGRAADELGITQPALSRSIAGLEQRYGFRIFDRGRSGVTVTPVGAQVITDAETLLRDAQALEHNLMLYGRGDAGKVAFGMGPLIASLVLPRLGADVLAARPKLQMRCSIKSADVLMRELLGDAIEMMFCASEQISPSPEVVIEPLGEVKLAFIARSGHPLAGRAQTTLAELSAYPVASAAELHAVHLPGLSGALICDNYEILRQVVLNGDTVWMSSPNMVPVDIAAGRLCEIEVDDLPPRLSEVAMVRLSSRTNSPAARAIADHVAQLLDGGSLDAATGPSELV